MDSLLQDPLFHESLKSFGVKKLVAAVQCTHKLHELDKLKLHRFLHSLWKMHALNTGAVTNVLNNPPDIPKETCQQTDFMNTVIVTLSSAS